MTALTFEDLQAYLSDAAFSGLGPKRESLKNRVFS
jgi:hypothetical protein